MNLHVKLCISFTGKTPTLVSLKRYLNVTFLFWEQLKGSLWIILDYISLFLENCSIFFHETLYIYFWYFTGGHCTKHIFCSAFVSSGGYFEIIYSLFWDLYLYILRTLQFCFYLICAISYVKTLMMTKLNIIIGE